MYCCLECVQLLLAHGAPVKVKNALGWTPLAEAISLGDRQTSKRCFLYLDSVFLCCVLFTIIVGYIIVKQIHQTGIIVTDKFFTRF